MINIKEIIEAQLRENSTTRGTIYNMIYPIGTTFRFDDDDLKHRYGILIINVDERRYTLEWTALEDDVEGHAKGEKWTSKWNHDMVVHQMVVHTKPVFIPEELFII